MTPDEIEELAWGAFARNVYAKNIDYTFAGPAPKNWVAEHDFYKKVGGSPGETAWMLQRAYEFHGQQIHVQKEVSDDLLSSDFAGATLLENIHWPAKVMEVYFEDPRLPTIVLGKIYAAVDIPRWFPGLHSPLTEREFINVYMQEGKMPAPLALSLQLRRDMYQAFMDTGTVPAMDMGPVNHPLNDQDHAAMCFMLHLALKVFAFAATQHGRPQTIGRKQMQHGGKPGVAGRPNRPAARVFYLPNVRAQLAATQQLQAQPEFSGRAFLGRRGFFRFYKHERYTIPWSYVLPVPGPDGTIPRRKAVVRKPQERSTLKSEMKNGE